MTAIATGPTDLYEALRRRATVEDGVRVGDLVTGVAGELGEDMEQVTAAMWDLVERGELDYGANARVCARSGE